MRWQTSAVPAPSSPARFRHAVSFRLSPGTSLLRKCMIVAFNIPYSGGLRPTTYDR